MFYLIVVDMQNDFITGALGTKEAQEIVSGVVEKVKHYHGNVIFTQDTHSEDYLNTQEGKNLPVKHCIIGEEGWMLHPDLEKIAKEKGWKIYQKPTFGCVQLAIDLCRQNSIDPIEGIEICGLCTDICVISNALLLKAYLPQTFICVDADCCAGVTKESHQNALEAMKMCQISINTKE